LIHLLLLFIIRFYYRNIFHENISKLIGKGEIDAFFI